MQLKSFAKINLSLKVNRKIKKSKLHNIQSFFCLINIFDEININKINKGKDIINFRGKFSKHINNRNNSVQSTLNYLRKKGMISSYYQVNIKKNIPVFSGLGGGTSNSATLLKFLLQNKKKTNLDQILKTGKFGTDTKIFFYKQGYIKNLNQFINFKKRKNLHFLLVYPNVECSTRQIYSKVKNFSNTKRLNWKKIKDHKNFIKFLKEEKNDLQSIVEAKYPIIKRIISKIKKIRGCYYSRITGSGSVCYGVFKSKTSAKAALISLKSENPQYWVALAKTI